MSTQIARDPFARATLMRVKAPGECRWCGQPGRWSYRWESDGILPCSASYSGPFCSIGCYRTFYS